MRQAYTSAATSINATRVPAVFRTVNWNPGTVNLDYGGGRYDTAIEYLRERQVVNLIYDPYNRPKEHNAQVLAAAPFDTATLSNVLNVIAEPEVRQEVLRHVRSLLRPGAPVYITVYEGDGAGQGRATKAGYQLNRRTADYLPEVREVFPSVVRRGRVIIART